MQDGPQARLSRVRSRLQAQSDSRAAAIPKRRTRSGCEALLPAADFYRLSGAPDGLAAWCKTCYAAYHKERTQALVSETVGEQRSSSCRRVKPAAEFRCCLAMSPGLLAWCKQCAAPHAAPHNRKRSKQP